MSDKPQDWDRTRDEIISGEYVLGVLSEEDRRRVEARIASDPKFANQVRRWQANLADFNDGTREAGPAPEFFGRIDAKFLGVPEPVQPATLFHSVWNSVPVWRGLTVLALVSAIGIGVADRVVSPGSASAAKPLVAELTGMDSPISLVASYDIASGRLGITPAALRQEEAKSLEIWLIAGDKQPQSLGVLPDNGSAAIEVPSEMRSNFVSGRTIAITVEPFGGSPTGRPTGPVIALGKTKGA